MKTISILGGTGFVGTELIGHLSKEKININVYTRNLNKANNFKVLPRVTLIQINESSNISDLLKGSDVVINLVGILHETKSLKFSSAHTDWVKKIVAGIKKHNIGHFIHIGAMQSNRNAPSRYLKSKYDSEEQIRKGLKNRAWTIFRPSIIYGENDKFINLFKKMVVYLPIVFLVSPKTKFQPIFVRDLVDIIIQSINDKKSYGKIYNIAGPKTFSLLEIVKLIAAENKRKVLIIPLGRILSYMMVRVIEVLPYKIITRDNLMSMELDNVTDVNDSYCFKSNLRALPNYLQASKVI